MAGGNQVPMAVSSDLSEEDISDVNDDDWNDEQAEGYVIHRDERK